MNLVLVLDRDESFKVQLRMAFAAKGLKVVDTLDAAAQCAFAEVLGPSEAATACITSCRVQGCAIVKQVGYVAVLLNLNQLAPHGLSALRRFTQLWPNAAVIVLAERADPLPPGDIQEVRRQGATEFLVKPVSVAYLERIIFEKRKGVHMPSPAKEPVPSPMDVALVGECDAMKALYLRILQIGQMEKRSGRLRAVLITGETGTGKQLVARSLHQVGACPNGPFVEINCAAIPAALLEAELFGFEKGAFTDAKATKPGLFEEADGGTLFLDEICSMDLPVQAKLLKAIEDKCIRRIGGLRSRSVEVRVIAASNKTSAADIGQALRQDLFYRLSALTVAIPPLRDRGQDILTIARHFLGKIAAECGGPVKRLTPEAEGQLLRYRWPGNVRELQNVIEGAAIQAPGETIGYLELGNEMPHTPVAVSIANGCEVAVEFGRDGIDLERVERQIIAKALLRAHWNRAEAARLLGISRETLRYRIEKFGLNSVDRSWVQQGTQSLLN